MTTRTSRQLIFLWLAMAASGCAAAAGPTSKPPTAGDEEESADGSAVVPPAKPDAAADRSAPPPVKPDAGEDPLPPDAAAASDLAGDDGRAADASADTTPAATGTRVSLEETVTARWTGTRRTITMEGASKIFTAGFEAGKFGAGGNGHLIRLMIAPGREYVFEYRLRFDTGFDFSRGGKIPGLAGATSPSGCQTSTGTGFTARQMWRENGRLIGYIYDMDQRSDCGNAIETGFNFAVGRWYQIKQRIKLNTGSSRNGILQLWIDDRMVINRSNMGWMIESPTRFIDKIFLDFFFGGSTADWSPRRNCSLSFSDLYITKLAD